MVKVIFKLLMVTLLTGCGYSFDTMKDGMNSCARRTISIPYATNDEDGEVTEALIRLFDTSGEFRYVSCGGAYLLKVNILDFNDENIGFRYDRNNEGKLVDALIPVESRLRVTAEVSLIDSCTGVFVFEPVIISASWDFDYDDAVNREGVFSLGQLADKDTAIEIASRPLNIRLAENIYEYVADHW